MDAFCSSDTLSWSSRRTSTCIVPPTRLVVPIHIGIACQQLEHPHGEHGSDQRSRCHGVVRRRDEVEIIPSSLWLAPAGTCRHCAGIRWTSLFRRCGHPTLNGDGLVADLRPASRLGASQLGDGTERRGVPRTGPADEFLGDPVEIVLRGG